MDATLRIEMMPDSETVLPAYAPHASFEELYRREYPNLVAVAHALTGASHAAEDLVQDTMVRAFLNWDKVGRYNRPGGWCLRVLTNACRSWWRRESTAQRWLARQRRDEPWQSGPSGADLAFWAVVRQLPERPRRVVVLFYAGERTVTEIASILNVPDGTVKSDLARSRAAILAELER